MNNRKFATKVRSILQEVNAQITDKEILERLSAFCSIEITAAAINMLADQETRLEPAPPLPESFSLVETSDRTGCGDDVTAVYILRRRNSPIGVVDACISGNGRTDYSWKINRTQRREIGYDSRNTAAAAAVDYYLSLK